jgi:hypothetical protein
MVEAAIQRSNNARSVGGAPSGTSSRDWNGTLELCRRVTPIEQNPKPERHDYMIMPRIRLESLKGDITSQVKTADRNHPIQLSHQQYLAASELAEQLSMPSWIRVSTLHGKPCAVVPNGSFISGRVTNWTFSDRQRERNRLGLMSPRPNALGIPGAGDG